MFSLASRLRKAGCKTAILSNTELPLVGIINKQKYDAFDITSCPASKARPNLEEKFTTSLSLGSVFLPGQALFIDDKPENIDGAKQAGLQTILFEGIEKLKKELAGFFPNIV